MNVVVVSVGLAVLGLIGLCLVVAYCLYKRHLKLSHTTLFDDSASLGSHEESRIASTLKTPLLRFQSVP
ncbi:hypothetical protein Pcinc_042751, partial [Petrolisthes cinctipes]